MSEKRINGRIVLKHDVESNWKLATGFTPMAGEVIIFDIDENYSYERIKIGDGVQNVNDLPFVTETVDWNDLLNRPFGEVPEYYVDKCTVECTDIHYLYVDAAKSVIIGETYTVIFDGVEYECECLSPKGFGNLSLYYDDAEDTGEPFLLRYDGMVNGYVLTVKETGTHTISIEKKVVECIDEKYIPETIARVADLPSLDGLASESYVDDKITEFVGDTTVAEQIAAAETEMSGIYAPIDSPAFTGNISFGRKADTTVGYQSVALGSNVEASGYLANATGSSTVASGPMSHAEGASSKSTSDSSHAEGGGTTASGSASHSEGRSTVASGSMAHSEGYMTTASGEMSHAEGNNTSSEGSFSHAEGLHTVTRSDSSHVQGQYNIIEPYISNVETLTGTIKADSNGHWIFDSYTFDSSTGKYTPSDTTKYTSLPNNTTQYFAVKPSYVTATTCTEMFRFTDITAYSSSSVTGTYEHYVSALEHDYAHVVGNGENDSNRSNAHTIDWDGNAWFAGNVTVGAESKELATQEYVDNTVSTIPTPDVSGQIDVHNNSETAHSDIRTSINNLSALVGDTAVSEQVEEAVSKIEVPVQSVNGKTGAITLTASDVGALADTVEIPKEKLFTAVYNGTSYNVSVTSTGFTYTAGHVLVISFTKDLTDEFLTLNVNSLGSKNIYNEFTSSVSSNIYIYKVPVKSGDTLILMYDQNNHFVVLSHTRKTIFIEELEDEIKERLLPYANVSSAGNFARISEGGEWVSETVEIPSIEGLATETYVDAAVAAMVDSAPETLNTLNELAAALGDDPNFATTVATQIGELEDKVGDTSVSEQIETAMEDIYTQEEVDVLIAAMRPKSTTVTLPASNWAGDTNPWSQVVTVNGVTANSKVDLQPTAVQIVELQDNETTLMLQNDEGIITAWAIGTKPTQDYSMQVLITEVVHV